MAATINIWQDLAFDTATSFLHESLRTVFGENVKIQTISTEQLEQDDTWNPEKVLMVIIPPIKGESCRYEQAFTNNAYNKKKDFILNGGVTTYFCSGAYLATSRVHFTSPTTGIETSKNSSMHVVEGLAWGPLTGLGRAQAQHNRYSDCIVTPVTYNRNGEEITFGSTYGNGCTFEFEDPEIKTLLRYAHDTKHQPAIIEKPIGQGFSILSGVVPHYGHQKDLQNHVLKILYELNLALKPHEVERACFMTGLWARVAHHGVEKGILSDHPTDIDPNIQIIDTPTDLTMPLKWMNKIKPVSP